MGIPHLKIPENCSIQSWYKESLGKWWIPGWLSGKESLCQCRRLYSWVWTVSWRRERVPTPVFLSGKSHWQRSLAGYSPWDCRRVDLRHDLATEPQQQTEKFGKCKTIAETIHSLLCYFPSKVCTILWALLNENNWNEINSMQYII